MILFITLGLLVLATVTLAYLTVMDIRFFLLPDKANIILAALGVAYQALQLNWADGDAVVSMALTMFFGALFGAGIFLVTRAISLKWKGVEGIGWGDVKFSAAAGLWIGPAGVGFMIGGAAFLLLVAGGLIMLVTKRPLKDFYLPFGAAGAPVTAALIWLQWAGMITL